MSWRIMFSLQPARLNAQATPRMNATLIFIAHLGDVLGIDALQEPGGFHQMEFMVMRFDPQEEAVAGSVLEALDVEERMMRLRQPIQRQHAEDGEGRRAKHGQFKG